MLFTNHFGLAFKFTLPNEQTIVWNKIFSILFNYIFHHCPKYISQVVVSLLFVILKVWSFLKLIALTPLCIH